MILVEALRVVAINTSNFFLFDAHKKMLTILNSIDELSKNIATISG
jgi:hypothetical protein